MESISFLHLHGMPLRIVGIDSVVAGPLLFPGDVVGSNPTERDFFFVDQIRLKWIGFSHLHSN